VDVKQKNSSFSKYIMYFDKRAMLFIFACIPLRLYLAYLPQAINKKYYKYGAFALTLMSLGTLYLAFTNGRMNAPEGGGKTWWAPVRFIHGALLAAAAIYLYRSDKNATLPLMIDAIIGILFFFTIRLNSL